MSQTSYSPSPDMVEMNRIHYELEYTEGINQRMRIPERLKVASGATEDRPVPLHEVPLPTSMMHVPERIVVAGTQAAAHAMWPYDGLRFTVRDNQTNEMVLFFFPVFA